MKRILAALAVLLAAGLTPNALLAQSQAPARKDSMTRWVRPADIAERLDSLLARLADKRALILADNGWRVGRLRNNAVLLDSLLADGWTATVTGLRGNASRNRNETKAHYLADVQSGSRSYESIVDDDTEVRIQGDSAVVTGRTTSKGYLNDEFLTGTSQFTRTYARRQGRWQMVASTSTAKL